MVLYDSLAALRYVRRLSLSIGNFKRCHVAHPVKPDFGSRLRYVLWLHHLVRGEPLGFAEIARLMGDVPGGQAVAGQSVSGWVRRSEATDSRTNNRSLALALGVSEEWLVTGKGDAPNDTLWRVWVAARGHPVKRWESGLNPVVADDGKAHHRKV